MLGNATPVNDGLVNVISGLGGGQDKRTFDRWSLEGSLMDQAQVEAAYRSSWLVRKVHDLPPFDMTREGRDWQAEGDQIEAIEAEEARLQLWPKIRRALLLARLVGGGALILGVNQGDPDQPLVTASLGKDSLKYVHVVSRYQLSLGELDLDITSATFGQPSYFQMTGGTGTSVKLHPSRVIAFVGQPLPEGALMTGADQFWGDPLLQSLNDAMKNADLTQGGIASLVHEAKVDTLSIPRLSELVATTAGEASLMKRIGVANLAKSILNTRILDSEEKWETRELTFSALPDILRLYLQIAAGAADIPATRLLGVAPQGMNATGESDLVNYYDSLSSKQESDLRPMLERIDEVLIPSALGSRPAEIHWKFAPLWKMTEEKAATVQKTKAETAQIYVAAGLVPLDPMAEAVQNGLVEDGVYPGLEAALEAFEAQTALEPTDPAAAPDPSAMSGEGDPVPPAKLAAPVGKAAPVTDRRSIVDRLLSYLQGEPAFVKDAKPRSLYVSRKVINIDEITAWAKAQGFKTVQEDLHVTVTFSRTPVDWLAMGENWSGDEKGQITINPGGPRVVEQLGPKGAVVLMFSSDTLAWRNRSMRDLGASWDWPEYTPHVTITYDTEIDPETVIPYSGMIVLGPEIFEEIIEGWEEKATES